MGRDGNNNRHLDFARGLARRAGEIMLEHFAVGVAFTSKADASRLTVADTAVNRMVIEEVARAFPDHGVRGEEESSQQDHHTMVWVCDPIDGTLPYSHGIPTNMFSLALVEDGKPIIGVVYDPYLRRLFTAQKAKGAFLNDRPIRVSASEVVAHQSMSISGDRGIQHPPGIYAACFDQGLEVFAQKSCVYSSMLVASGQFIGHVYGGQHSHDVAAVKIIVEEAGGKVTNLRGEEQRYDRPVHGALISNGAAHDDLISLIKPHLI